MEKLNFQTNEKQLDIALSEIFEACEEQVITIPLADLAAIVKQQNKSFVSETLRRMVYKLSEYPSAKYFPRIVERKDANGDTTIGCEVVKFKGRYYTFYWKDFIGSKVA